MTQAVHNKIRMVLLFLVLSFSLQQRSVSLAGEPGTLVRSLLADPDTLDPAKVADVYSCSVLTDLFEGLVTATPDQQSRPGLASDWMVGEEGRLYTFRLRDNLQWSDGQPLTADDVVFSARRLVTPETASPYADLLSHAGIVNAAAIIAGKMLPESLGVKAITRNKVEIRLAFPSNELMPLLASCIMLPVPERLVRDKGRQWTNPENMISSGAYRIASWSPNEHIMLTRNNRYHDEQNVAIQHVRWQVTASESAELMRYKAGEIDITVTVPLQQQKQIAKEYPDQLVITPVHGIYFYTFNMRKPPFDNAYLRKALMMAMDRDKLKKILPKGTIPIWTHIPASATDYDPLIPDWAKWDDKRRLNEARALYARAGYSTQKPLKFRLLFNKSEGHQMLAVALASIWKENLGAEIILDTQEWKVYLDNMRNGNFQMARAGMASVIHTGPSLSFITMTTGYPINTSGFSNSRYDDLISSAMGTNNKEVQNRLYIEAENIFLETLPILPVYQHAQHQLVRPRVKGYRPGPIISHMPSRMLWLEK